MGHVLLVLVLTLWAMRVGTSILILADAVPEHRWDRRAIACTLGLGTLAMLAFGLGEIRHLHRVGLVCVLVGGGLATILVPRRLLRSDPPSIDDEGTPLWVSRTFDLTLGLTILGTFLTALSPATDGDALCYHLQVPKIFLLEHAVTYEPDLHETIYPLLTEMLYAVALAFRGPIACKLIQWVLGLCFAGCVTAIARPSLGARARWAGTIAMLVPAVSNGMSAPLNDVALAAWSNAALWAVMMWRDRPSKRRAVLAGLLAGMAIGVKYPALVWVGLLAAFMTYPPRADGIGKSARVQFVLFLSVMILAGGGWYLRAYVRTGNPVFPFFRDFFGGAGIDDVLDPIKRPLTVTLPHILAGLAYLTLQPDRFDSLSHQFGPVFLLMVPGLFLLKPPRRVVILAFVGFVFLSLCLTQRQSMRFVLMALGPFSVAAAWVAGAWLRRGRTTGRILVAGLLGMLIFEAMLPLGRSRHGLSVVIGQDSEEGFLSKREPTYQVGRWVEANLASSSRLIGQDHRGYYIPRPYVMELAHRRRTGLASREETPEEIVTALRDDGFTHLLLCPPEPESAVEYDPTLLRKLGPWIDSHRPIFHRAITDPDGVTRLYTIHDLRVPGDEPTRLVRR